MVSGLGCTLLVNDRWWSGGGLGFRTALDGEATELHAVASSSSSVLAFVSVRFVSAVGGGAVLGWSGGAVERHWAGRLRGRRRSKVVGGAVATWMDGCGGHPLLRSRLAPVAHQRRSECEPLSYLPDMEARGARERRTRAKVVEW